MESTINAVVAETVEPTAEAVNLIKRSAGKRSAKRSANSGKTFTSPAKRLLGSSKVASLSDVRRIAKDMAKQLQAASKPSASTNALATVIDNSAHWARVDCIKNGFSGIESPAMRKLLVANINAELAQHGLESLKNQDFRHWACCAKLEKDFPNIDFRQYSETAMEKTALKWYGGSFSDLIDNGIDTFGARTGEKVKVGDEELPVDMLVDNMEASLAKYASPKKKSAEKPTRRQRVEKSAKKLVAWMKKEYGATKGELIAFIREFAHQLRNTPATEPKQDGTETLSMLDVYNNAITDDNNTGK